LRVIANSAIHPSGAKLRKAEAAVAALLTLVAIWLRLVAATSAGAMWRDEANTVGLATLPSVHDVWENLQFDSFPILWLLIVRQLATFAGPLNDSAFRALGFVIGAALVAGLWFYARAFRYSFPLVSLALLAMTPSVIVWGDSVRAYGLGMVLMIVAGALLWRLVERPTAKSFTLAALAAMASVQILFYNSVLLLAFCAGAGAVCARRRAWRTAWLVVAVGAVAAISVIPYWPAIRNASTWNMLVRIPRYTFSWFWSKLYETLRPGGPWALIVWTEVLVLALIAAVRAVRFPNELGHSGGQRDVALFSSVTLVVSLPAVFLFLRTLSYPTQPWYYLTLLAVSAVCIDAIAGSLIHSETARKARLVGVLLLAGATFTPALRAAQTRMTDVDLIAAQLERIVEHGDFVVVNPWFNGVTFSRYYRSPVPWMTLPPIEFHRYHRYDLIKRKMIMADQRLPLRPLEDRMSAALRTGHRVFIVGDLPLVPVDRVPQILPAAPLPGDGWPEGTYNSHWSIMVAHFLERHSTRIVALPVKDAGRVSPFEKPSLIVATGWRP